VGTRVSKTLFSEVMGLNMCEELCRRGGGAGEGFMSACASSCAASVTMSLYAACGVLPCAGKNSTVSNTLYDHVSMKWTLYQR
jgi:hypothetical protein